METITVNKRDSDNYEITIHKGYDNITITKDKAGEGAPSLVT